MNAVSLFSGIGGMDIAFAAAGFDIIAQVEINEFCQRVLRKHKRYWPHAALFADVRRFGIEDIPAGIIVDCLFGGFPCQPFSVAGKQEGADDHRNFWPEFRRIIGEIRPRAVLLENVPGIVAGYGGVVVGDLSAIGYDAQWDIISAADAGASHLRERWWLVAYANSERQPQPAARHAAFDQEQHHPAHQCPGGAELYAPEPGGEVVAYGDRQRPAQPQGTSQRRRRRVEHCRQTLGNPQKSRLAQRRHRSPGHPRLRAGSFIRRRQPAQSRLGRAAHGLSAWLDRPRWPAGQGAFQYPFEAPRTIPPGQDPHRKDRVEALGNAVVPQVVYPLACGIRDQLLKH